MCRVAYVICNDRPVYAKTGCSPLEECMEGKMPSIVNIILIHPVKSDVILFP